MRFTHSSSPGAAAHTAGPERAEDRHGLARAFLAAGASLMVALLGLSLAASAAQATTFPGSNGKIGASGPLNQASLGSKLELFTLSSQANECRLTFNENSDYNPRFSKDGKTVVYIKDSNLWTLKLDDKGECAVPGSQVQLTGLAENAVTAELGGDDTWVGGWCEIPASGGNPLQQWVVFQRSIGSFDVYKQRVNPATRTAMGDAINLTFLSPANDSQPSVTPGCEKIAFHSNRRRPTPTTTNSDIWTMDFNGGALKNRSEGCSNTEESAPSWSPNGTRITFQTNQTARDAAVESRNMEIYRMDDADADANKCGDNEKRLTYSGANKGPTETGFDVTGFDLTPSYSPDASRICFHSGRAVDGYDPAFRLSGSAGIVGQWEIYTVDAVAGEYDAVKNVTGIGAASRKTKRPGNDERCGWQSNNSP